MFPVLHSSGLGSQMLFLGSAGETHAAGGGGHIPRRSDQHRGHSCHHAPHPLQLFCQPCCFLLTWKRHSYLYIPLLSFDHHHTVRLVCHHLFISIHPSIHQFSSTDFSKLFTLVTFTHSHTFTHRWQRRPSNLRPALATVTVRM